jgi:hexokinase
MLKSNSPKLNFTISFPIPIPQIQSSQIIKKASNLKAPQEFTTLKLQELNSKIEENWITWDCETVQPC